ncbi:MAG: Ig-like domain-containing protein [Gemmatimonadetes bacterium]|nr:Ig-like domain-containing protein [Gemmatimonadota bacterium]
MRWGVLVGLLAGTACMMDLADTPGDAATELASVIPAGGSTGVHPDSPIVVEFTHAMGMGMGMEMYAALHEGDVNGPVVAGTWSWSADRRRATFTPASSLRSRTRYTIHVGGGMRDAGGNPIGFDQHGQHMGGRWVMGQMMSGGMMSGMNNMMSGMMGPGWQHANGTYGMIFPFTTA